MPPFFVNATMNLYSYSESEELDEYDEPIISYIFRESIPVNLQPLSPQSSMQQFGKILEDTYTIILDLDKTLNDTDIIKFDNDNSTYRIIGSVSEWNHFLNYKEAIIQKQRTNEDVIEDV